MNLDAFSYPPHKNRLLLIEDEADIATLLTLQAEASGYKLLVETNGIDGYKTIEKEKPDLVILDLMLPGQNGLDVCRKIKGHPDLHTIPVLILTAKAEELDMILGLELGADDYVAKPFSPKVLFSRIKAILRRGKEMQEVPQSIAFGEFILEIDRYMLRKKGQILPITLSEFSILKRLLIHRGKVLTRNQLLEDIHNDDSFIIDRNIDVHIASLRKKLGPNFEWIATVRGIGYRFLEEDSLAGKRQN